MRPERQEREREECIEAIHHRRKPTSDMHVEKRKRTIKNETTGECVCRRDDGKEIEEEKKSEMKKAQRSEI